MTQESNEIVLACRERMLALADNEPESWHHWEHNQWQEALEHGPRYLCGHWFGGMPESRRMRYRRAIDALETAGLLTTWRNGGLRLSHIKLTDAGLALAATLSSSPQSENQT
jgi:hypothetical protein